MIHFVSKEGDVTLCGVHPGHKPSGLNLLLTRHRHDVTCDLCRGILEVMPPCPREGIWTSTVNHLSGATTTWPIRVFVVNITKYVMKPMKCYDPAQNKHVLVDELRSNGTWYHMKGFTVYQRPSYELKTWAGALKIINRLNEDPSYTPSKEELHLWGGLYLWGGQEQELLELKDSIDWQRCWCGHKLIPGVRAGEEDHVLFCERGHVRR